MDNSQESTPHTNKCSKSNKIVRSATQSTTNNKNVLNFPVIKH